MRYGVNITKGSVTSSFFWKAFERIAAQGINLVIQIVLARLLLPEEFGSLAILVAIINYVGIFVQSGLGTAIVQKEDLDDLDVSTLFTASLGVAFIFYCGLFALAPIISSYYKMPNLIWPLRVLALSLFLSAVNSIQTGILSRRMQFKRIFMRSMIAIPVSGAIGIVLAYCGFGLWSLVIQNLLNSLIVVIVMSIGNDMSIKLGFSVKKARELYLFSGKILLANLVSGLHDTIRTMTIGKKYSAVDLAYYDKAYTYSNYITQVVNGSINSVLLPVFSRSQTQNEKLKEMARKSCRLAAFIMFPILLGVAGVARPLVSILLTDKWLPCVPYLIVFCVLRMPGCIMAIDKQMFYALGRSGINLVYEIFLLILNLSVLSVTVRYGVFAIAIGATAVELVGSAVIAVIGSKTYSYRVREKISDIIKPLINSCIMFFVVYYIGKIITINEILVLFIQIIFGILVYILLGVVTRDAGCKYLLSIIKNFKKRNLSKGD